MKNGWPRSKREVGERSYLNIGIVSLVTRSRLTPSALHFSEEKARAAAASRVATPKKPSGGSKSGTSTPIKTKGSQTPSTSTSVKFTPAKPTQPSQLRDDLEGLNLGNSQEEEEDLPPPKISLSREKLLDEARRALDTARTGTKKSLSVVIIGECRFPLTESKLTFDQAMWTRASRLSWDGSPMSSVRWRRSDGGRTRGIAPRLVKGASNGLGRWTPWPRSECGELLSSFCLSSLISPVAV